MVHKLGEVESRALLFQGRTGRLGCICDGKPYVVPVSYWFDGQSIYIHSLPGRKVTALRAHPRACLQVDEMTDEVHWKSVLAFGHYEEVRAAQERERILREVLARFPHFTPVESAMSEIAGVPQIIIFRLRVETITGVTEGA